MLTVVAGITLETISRACASRLCEKGAALFVIDNDAQRLFQNTSDRTVRTSKLMTRLCAAPMLNIKREQYLQVAAS